MKDSHVEDGMMAERFLIALAEALCIYCEDGTAAHKDQVEKIIAIQKELGATNFFIAFKNQAEMFINETKQTDAFPAGWQSYIF
jgi:hypothetical protein